MPQSQDLFIKSLQVIPGGVNSPVRAFKSVGREPLFIQKAKGSRIYDADAREYIDFVGSWGPMIVGHAHDEVIEAVCEAAQRGTSFGAPTEIELSMAERIIEMVPSIEMVRMVNSGTEATMSALRLARAATGRDYVVKFEGCYHGHADSFLVKAGSGALTLGAPDSPGVPAATAQYTLTANYNDLESVQKVFAQYSGKIACVIVEPVAGNMGVIAPQEGFLQGLRELCTANHSVLIFDEVMSGFRVHPGGAQALYGVTPDLTTLGKVIGGGLPAAAYGGKKELMQMIAPSGSVYQAGTLSGNPLAMAAGLKTLEIINRPGFYEDLNKKAVLYFGAMQDYLQLNQLPIQLNFVNSMGCLFFSKAPVKTFADAAACNTAQFATFFNIMLEKGVYFAPSQFEAMFLSGAHSNETLIAVGERVKEALQEVLQAPKV
jgi:glutamate-1-semialdehyde 2,1-aminomutase